MWIKVESESHIQLYMCLFNTNINSVHMRGNQMYTVVRVHYTLYVFTIIFKQSLYDAFINQAVLEPLE